MKSFTEHFIRVWIHTSKISKVSRNISYVYEFIRRRFHTRIKSNAFEKIRVCKIPWMILHNDTRIKSYTYEKLHVWTVTRMKNYTYEKLHVLNIEFWLVHCYTRIDSFTELLIRVCFLTWNFSYVEPLPLFVHFGQPYLCGEFTGTGEFLAQRASNAENVSIWWRHHANGFNVDVPGRERFLNL